MDIQRSITVYSQKTERLKEEINIDSIKLKELRRVIRNETDDPYLYGVYAVEEDSAQEWNALLAGKIKFDFQENAYFVECVQLPPYEFEKKKTIQEIEQLLEKLGAKQTALLEPEPNNHTPAVKSIPGFPNAEKVSSKAGKVRWRDKNGDILEWNTEAGDVEVYSKSGKMHRGAADPATGQIKLRTADPNKTTKN